MGLIRALAVAGFAATAPLAHAEDDEQAPIPFEGGTLTIRDTEEGDKVLAFDGKELARNYVVLYDKTVEVAGAKVALFAVGDGGNQCGPAEIIVWKPQDGAVKADAVGEDCGAPPAAVTDSSIYFVPYLLPGDTNNVIVWSPDTGVEVAGTISYSAQPGTGWQDLDPARFDYMVDSMKNAAVYAEARKLLGNKLVEVMTALGTGGNTEISPSGILHASGCVPHACGVADGFMAIDPKARTLYFAQQGDDPKKPATWPDLEAWPTEVKTLMTQALVE